MKPENYEDIIANLVRRVAQLESELTGAKRDIVTWSQEVEKVRHEIEAKVEMVIDDIVTLDERSQPKQITLDVDTFTKLIGGARG